MADRSQASSPMSEDQIRASTIGEPTPLNGPVLLVEYDLRWPERFARESGRIAGALGDRAIRVEHVGSTSVPGLVAKPVVDILLVVANSADEPSYVPDLEAAGYALRIREPAWHEHRLLKREDPAVHLHVFSRGSTEVERLLRFRDHLRTHPVDRELYARTKRELAGRTWKFRQNYADAKSGVVEAILSRAQSPAPP